MLDPVHHVRRRVLQVSCKVVAARDAVERRADLAVRAPDSRNGGKAAHPTGQSRERRDLDSLRRSARRPPCEPSHAHAPYTTACSSAATLVRPTRHRSFHRKLPSVASTHSQSARPCTTRRYDSPSQAANRPRAAKNDEDHPGGDPTSAGRWPLIPSRGSRCQADAAAEKTRTPRCSVRWSSARRGCCGERRLEKHIEHGNAVTDANLTAAHHPPPEGAPAVTTKLTCSLGRECRRCGARPHRDAGCATSTSRLHAARSTQVVQSVRATRPRQAVTGPTGAMPLSCAVAPPTTVPAGDDQRLGAARTPASGSGAAPSCAPRRESRKATRPGR